jgi:hypothetical protein
MLYIYLCNAHSNPSSVTSTLALRRPGSSPPSESATGRERERERERGGSGGVWEGGGGREKTLSVQSGGSCEGDGGEEGIHVHIWSIQSMVSVRALKERAEETPKT